MAEDVPVIKIAIEDGKVVQKNIYDSNGRLISSIP